VINNGVQKYTPPESRLVSKWTTVLDGEKRISGAAQAYI